MGTLLWWGRFDPDYSRNGVMRALLGALGHAVRDFHPLLSKTASLEASLRRIPRPDAVWAPCFRQRDVAEAARWARRRGVPLIFDPLISAYDKQVFERGKLAEGSAAARRLLAEERAQFALADLVIADTARHAEFFRDTLGVAPERLAVVYVGADERLFAPAPLAPPDGPLEALFYGSFIPLHGAEAIVEAARLYRGPEMRWTLLGDGPALERCRQLARGNARIAFEPPVPYAKLCERIHRAGILLGIFGTTAKAGRVMPNKFFQALASGRPVITRDSGAYPAECRSSGALAFVPPGDAAALAEAARRWAEEPGALAGRCREARALYERLFSRAVIQRQLADALARLPAFR